MLGHIIITQGIKQNPDKIEAITKYPIPMTRTEIKSFLGVLNFAKIAKSLTVCLIKDTKIVPTKNETYTADELIKLHENDTSSDSGRTIHTK